MFKMPRTLLSNPPTGWSRFYGTLAGEVNISGIGLHTGSKVNVRLLPRSGESNERGILFKRSGHPGSTVPVTPRPELWEEHPMSSNLRGPDGSLFRTVEHLLASLRFCEIDHAVVELDGEEVPILDGSATEWVQAIQSCGRVQLPHSRRFLRIRRPYKFRFGPKCVYSVEPSDSFRLSVALNEREFGFLEWKGQVTPSVFASEIAPARSYGRITEGLGALAVGYLSGTPLLRGARFSSVAAILNRRVIGGMRFQDEFARHRVLDLCGDLSTAGGPILGHFRILQPSHRRSLRFIRQLMGDHPDFWEWAVFFPYAPLT